MGAGYFYPYRGREKQKRRGPAGPLVVTSVTHGSSAAHQGTAMAMWAPGALTVQIVKGIALQGALIARQALYVLGVVKRSSASRSISRQALAMPLILTRLSPQLCVMPAGACISAVVQPPL